MEKRLFLLDGMALAYRAHFAFITRPIRSSTGVNTSALFGFTNTLIELVENQKPTHMAVVFDTDAPTARHALFRDYKANRQEMPEDLGVALPHLRRFAQAFGIPVLAQDGFEADDVIGTLAQKAEEQGFVTYMVTPDKDFGQLVTPRVFIYRPGYKGEAPEILGVPEVLARWDIERIDQVIDMLALIGDTTDNIPGVPGVGPKTAQKLIREFGSLEELLARADEVKGKLGEKLQQFAEQARLSKTLATIDREVPVTVDPSALALGQPDYEQLRALFAEFEFRSLAKRVLGSTTAPAAATANAPARPAEEPAPAAGQGELQFLNTPPSNEPGVAAPSVSAAQLELPVAPVARPTMADVPHQYADVATPEARAALLERLRLVTCFSLATQSDGLDPRTADLVGVAFAWEPHRAYFMRLPAGREAAREALAPFQAVFGDPEIEKVGHDLKSDLAVLKRHGIEVEGPLFDAFLVHSLIEPDQRHSRDYLSEVFLNYAPIPFTRLVGDGVAGPQKPMAEVDPEALADYAAESADVIWQLREKLLPLLRERGQERVYHEVEAPLIRTLVDMEHAGVALDIDALAAFGRTLEAQAAALQQRVFELVGRPFNLSSPKQLGEILFDELKLAEKPKKTRTGQYATNEQTLLALASRHPVVQAILEHRELVKLKGTYVDALPAALDRSTGRVHTHFTQLRAATGRLASDNPNLQNIPIRSEQGREIRRAFVSSGPDWLLLSADYSQIELRIIAAISEDPGMLEAFARGEDIHTATAARVYGVESSGVTREMRARAKMVNFGIPYGISAFGLAQRLGIPKSEAAQLIEGYFRQFSGIRAYIERTLEFCRAQGFVETVTGRRRYLPEIRSLNATVRGSAERNAINMPIQGTAADMIKIAMWRIHDDLRRRGLRTRLLLQVHDELLFEVPRNEEAEVREIIEHRMKTALELRVPLVVEIGVGANWLEAH